MVPWWVIPITAWASASIAIVAYAIVKVGADSERYYEARRDDGGDDGRA